jgi:hypothetical protein
VLGRIQLDVHERRQLERKRTIIEERIRALQSALDGDERGVPLIAQERAGTQRMYLSIMQSMLKRINSELRQHSDPGRIDQHNV